MTQGQELTTLSKLIINISRTITLHCHSPYEPWLNVNPHSTRLFDVLFTSGRRIFKECLLICKTSIGRFLQMSNRRLEDVSKM